MTLAYMPNKVSIGSLTLGTVDGNGVTWIAQTVAGWGSPAGTLNLTQRPRDHGAWRSNSFLTPRVIAITGTIQAPAPSLLAAARHQLNAACSLDDTTFSVTEYGETLYSTVTRQDEVLFGDETETWTTFSLQLVAEDPRRYGQSASLQTAMPSSSGGLTFSTTFPLVFASTVVPGVVSFDNPGNIDAPVTIRIDGPCSGPIVTHISSGSQLVFESSLTLGTGEWLIIDMAERTVKAQGQASRTGYVTSRGYFSLSPGHNDVAFNAQTYNSSARMTVTAPQGAWL